jgi:nicotinamidase-related amidase
MITLDPKTSALILVDLQQGILAMATAPRPASEVLQTGKALADRFRAVDAPVVLVRIAWAADFSDAPSAQVDQPTARPPGGLPPTWSVLADGLMSPADIVIVKRHWGAFIGTELDLQLRRRGVRTLALGGIATNFGVESTARSAWEHGYEVVVIEDACASVSAEAHDFAVKTIFPRIARVTAADAIGFA